jgi:hypothetical protein
MNFRVFLSAAPFSSTPRGRRFKSSQTDCDQVLSANAVSGYRNVMLAFYQLNAKRKSLSHDPLFLL